MPEPILLDTPGLTLGAVSLTPVQESDKDGLRAAANSEEIWEWYPFRGDGDYFDQQLWRWIYEMRNPEKEIKFTVRYDGAVVGTTCLLAIDERNKKLEIGGTWYTSKVRGTVVNPACKYLLIEHAFKWGAQRVEWKTDSNNARSRAAIEKLGAKLEGTLRNHMFLHDGRVRHSVYYSMLPEEWPDAKANLEKRIADLS